MPISQKIKDVATKAKSFVSEHKQAIFNTVMFVGLSGVSAAVVALTRENNLQNQNDEMLMNRHDYARDRIYKIERSVGMPVHEHDQRHHDYLESLKAEPASE